MLKEISRYLKDQLTYSTEDRIIFNNHLFGINKDNFSPIYSSSEKKTLAFVDGGQTEIFYSGNLCLSLIRIAGIVFNGLKKAKIKEEFYLLTKAKYHNDDIFYESKIFPENKLIDEQDLFISSNDQSIRHGQERAPLSQVTSMARRLAELSLAGKVEADIIVLDGALEAKYDSEQKYLAGNEKVCSLSKTCTLFTASGNNPAVLLNRISPSGCWSYNVAEKAYFVKLNERSKHVFRFEGYKEILPYLIEHSKDAVFLGYPYGLILADQLARVSNQEKKSMIMRLLSDKDNQELMDYLSAPNAHDILDKIR